MNPTRFLKGFVFTFILFALLDGFWHGSFLADFYGSRLMMINPTADMAGMSVSPFMFFGSAINAVTVTYMVLKGAATKRWVSDAAWIGGLIGFTVVSTLNSVNHVLIPHWDIVLVLVDVAWGTAAGIIAGVSVALICPPPERRGIWAWITRR